MRDLEDVAVRVTYHRPPVAVRRVNRCFEGRGARDQRTAIGRVGIGYVNVEECGKEISHAGERDHHKRVANADLRRSASRYVSLTIMRGVSVW